jgi:hypothetical protein
MFHLVQALIARHNILPCWIAAISLLSLAGCSTLPGSTLESYEGGGDHRFSNPPKDPKSRWQADWADKYQSLESRAETPGKFQPGDTISIYLKSAVFKYITEGNLKRWWAKQSRNSGKLSGQVAIIVNVAQDGPLNPLTHPADASNPGRIVYYSGDVEEGQKINQSFGPVFGPVEWQGGPITLDITVLEIDDEENRQTSALLSSLAKLGTSATVGASSSALALLNSLGAALVQSNRDDVMGRYRLTLTPDIPSTASLPLLREGDLIVIRQTDREYEFPWNKHSDDSKTAQNAEEEALYNPSTGTFKPVNGNRGNKTNYLVFTFVRNMPGIDLTPSMTTEQLLTQIRNAEPKDAIQPIQQFIEARQRESAWRQLQRQLGQLADKHTSGLYRQHLAEQLTLALQCISLHHLAAQAAPENKATAERATKEYCRSAENFNHLFTLGDFDTLIRRLGEVCKGDIDSAKANLTRSALLGDGMPDYSNLTQVLKNRASSAATALENCPGK